jgi:hypothetical protein
MGRERRCRVGLDHALGGAKAHRPRAHNWLRSAIGLKLAENDFLGCVKT